MAILERSGGMMNTIRCDETSYLVWKWRPLDHAANTTSRENSIRWGSSIRVKDGEMAIFVYNHGNEGKTHDIIMGPFDGILVTGNLPILADILGVAYGGDSPFQAEVYFINLANNVQILFGIPYFDVFDARFPDLPIPVAARGTITFNITDYETFISNNRLIDFELEDFKRQIRSTITKIVKNIVFKAAQQSEGSILQLEYKLAEISDAIRTEISHRFVNDYGVNLRFLDIEAIEVNKESPSYYDLKRLTTDVTVMKTHMEAQQEYFNVHAFNTQADVIRSAANSIGQNGAAGNNRGESAAGMATGFMMGGMIGQQMGGMMNNINQTVAANNQHPQTVSPQTPPPLPQNKQWYVAIGNNPIGPLSETAIRQLLINGEINVHSLYWNAEMTNWIQGNQIPEIIDIVNQLPPKLS